MAIVVFAASPDEFRWTGNDNSSDNWNSEANWFNVDENQPDGYAGEDSDDDIVTIDDTTPRAEAEHNVEGGRIQYLFLGDGHILNLTHGLNVLTPNGGSSLPWTGGVDCEGVVRLKGANPLTCERLMVYTSETTTIEVDASQSAYLTAGQ